jgi:hypothetical protein
VIVICALYHGHDARHGKVAWVRCMLWYSSMVSMVYAMVE